MKEPSLLLLEILGRRLDPSGRTWLERIEGITGIRVGQRLDPAFLETLPPLDVDSFHLEFTNASHWLGNAVLVLRSAERDALWASGVSWPIEGWRLDELGRVAMLALASSRLTSFELDQLVSACYWEGDIRERQAVLRALPLFASPERLLSVALEACRTKEHAEFEAIACENPYPADHFPDQSFNEMVFKAMQAGVSLDRILDLQRRMSPELQQMAEDYANQCRESGQHVPPDVERLFMEEEERITQIPE